MTPRKQAGRMVAVRLTDVPLHLRRRHGNRLHELAVQDRDLLLAAQLEQAVESPSTELHWLPEQAVRKVLG